MPMQQTPDGEAGAAAGGGRRPTVVTAPASPSPELSDRPRRRRTFTAQDKLRILAETDRATATGGIGAVLRREGLYSSALTEWRRQRDAGTFTALAPGKRGPKTAEPNPLTAEVTALQRDNARLALRLTRAEAIIDIQKKLRHCWASRWRPTTAKLDRRCRCTRTRPRHDRRGLRRAWGVACQCPAPPLPPGRAAGDRPPATDDEHVHHCLTGKQHRQMHHISGVESYGTHPRFRAIECGRCYRVTPQ